MPAINITKTRMLASSSKHNLSFSRKALPSRVQRRAITLTVSGNGRRAFIGVTRCSSFCEQTWKSVDNSRAPSDDVQLLAGFVVENRDRAPLPFHSSTVPHQVWRRRRSPRPTFGATTLHLRQLRSAPDVSFRTARGLRK